jgi:hypothetical protein
LKLFWDRVSLYSQALPPSSSVDQTGLKYSLLPQPPVCWDYKPLPPHFDPCVFWICMVEYVTASHISLVSLKWMSNLITQDSSKMMEGMNSTIIYCKNFCKCHNVPLVQ